jgi:hypothetical protein
MSVDNIITNLQSTLIDVRLRVPVALGAAGREKAFDIAPPIPIVERSSNERGASKCNGRGRKSPIDLMPRINRSLRVRLSSIWDKSLSALSNCSVKSFSHIHIIILSLMLPIR